MYVHKILFVYCYNYFLMLKARLKVDELFTPIPTDFIDGPSGGDGMYSQSQTDNRNNILLKRGLSICLCALSR